MNASAKVSIVLPVFNGERFIRQSIESCLGQTYPNIELVVWDDASSDDTPRIVRSIHDERIKYFREDTNQGHIRALNKAFGQTTGEFLSWTSHDNYYAPKAIEIMAGMLSCDARVDFVYADYDVVDESGLLRRKGRVGPPAGLDVDNYVGGCFLYRREVYETIGDFNPEAFLAEDYEYWLRVRQKFKMKMIHERLYYYRSHAQSLTGRHTEEAVQKQVEKVRGRFIAVWKNEYLAGKRMYHNGDRDDARAHIRASLRENPVYPPAWRLLALLYLNTWAVGKLRKMKNLLGRKF